VLRATSQVGKRRAAGQGGLQEVAEVGREPESEPVCDGDNFGVGQVGVELDMVDDEVAGCVLSVMVLGAAEVVDELLPDTGIQVHVAFAAELQD
jgi:hypothetical protein